MDVFSAITALVDKDVASNSKPISLIGMAIPFVPFMLFVDGAPVDSYPLLGGVALSMSIGWGVFVMWRVLRHAKVEMQPYKRELGPFRFWLLLVGTILTCVLLGTLIWWFEN